MLHLDHVGIVVACLDDTEAFLGAALGLPRSREQCDPERPDRSVFLGSGDVEIELIEVADPTMRAARLGDREARIEHLAFAVEDLDAEVARLRKMGVRMGDPLVLGGRRNAFSDPASSSGIMIQLAENAVT